MGKAVSLLLGRGPRACAGRGLSLPPVGGQLVWALGESSLGLAQECRQWLAPSSSVSLWPLPSSGLARLPVSGAYAGPPVSLPRHPRASSCRHSQCALGGSAMLSEHWGNPFWYLGAAPSPLSWKPPSPSPCPCSSGPRPLLGPPPPTPPPPPPRFLPPLPCGSLLSLHCQALSTAEPLSLLPPPPRALCPKCCCLSFLLFIVSVSSTGAGSGWGSLFSRLQPPVLGQRLVQSKAPDSL